MNLFLLMFEVFEKMIGINWGNLFRKYKIVYMDSICYLLFFVMRFLIYFRI